VVVRLHRDVLYDDGEAVWHHVLAVPLETHVRFGRVTRGLPQMRRRFALTTQAAAAIMTDLPDTDPGGVLLAVGGFEDHLEFALTVEGRLRHVHHAPGATPADAAYF